MHIYYCFNSHLENTMLSINTILDLGELIWKNNSNPILYVGSFNIINNIIININPFDIVYQFYSNSGQPLSSQPKHFEGIEGGLKGNLLRFLLHVSSNHFHGDEQRARFVSLECAVSVKVHKRPGNVKWNHFIISSTNKFIEY